MAGVKVSLLRVSAGLGVAGNSWTEVAAPEGRKEKGGRVKEEEERPKNVIWQLPNLPFNPSLILINSN